MAGDNGFGELTPREAQAAAYRAQGMSQSDAYRKAYNCRRAQQKTIHEKASRLFARDRVRARVRELLREARVQDIDSVGEAIDHLLRLLEKAERDGNYNAAAQLRVKAFFLSLALGEPVMSFSLCSSPVQDFRLVGIGYVVSSSEPPFSVFTSAQI